MNLRLTEEQRQALILVLQAALEDEPQEDVARHVRSVLRRLRGVSNQESRPE